MSKFTYDDEAHARLTEYARSMRKVPACNAIGYCAKTVTNAAKEAGRLRDLQALFPTSTARKLANDDGIALGGIHRVDLSQISSVAVSVPNTPVTRWLTRSWRAVA
ncbi:hypothetical protein [Marinobacter sp. BGYM27]|uniref:hypothetical protein n=1 Tax=Marinobacter sp. BGYM27 TaxID=2975597 RepID=UPI0021A58371|nr:hypothetical protein [Marinobacter sp. BGYM27]MDG5498925.1 hypothetical protein [Marinobacter sp. BGYM27]